MNGKMIELAYLRNPISHGLYNEKLGELMEKTKKNIISLDTPFNEIALNAINNCEEDINKGNFKSAARELHLIHNFTFNNPLAWNSDYFYKGELKSYIEQNEDIKRTKTLLLELGRLENKFENYNNFFDDIDTKNFF